VLLCLGGWEEHDLAERGKRSSKEDCHEGSFSTSVEYQVVSKIISERGGHEYWELGKAVMAVYHACLMHFLPSGRCICILCFKQGVVDEVTASGLMDISRSGKG